MYINTLTVKCGRREIMRAGAKRRRKRKYQNKILQKMKSKKVLIITGSLAGSIILCYLAIAVYFFGHFYINTEINGKDFSGKSVEDVENYIKEQVEGYELKILEQNNEVDVIRGSDISLVYRETPAIEEALKKQNPLLWVRAFFSESSAHITIDVEYDENALNEKIQSINAVTKEQTEPVSAHPKFDGNLFIVEPETYGNKVDLDVLNEKIEESITEFKSELNMMEEGCYVLPQYTSDSQEVRKACDIMNEYLKANITYKMDKDVVVDKELISTWLTYDDSMEVKLDQNKVTEWMREFGKTYDTVNKTRSITTPTGKKAEVSGGTYGWEIDEKAEVTALLNNIKNGDVVEKEPVYCENKTAAVHAEQDWGTTYVEVDLTEQYMWYIQDGNVAMEADVVTGLPTAKRQTPQGVYSILEKKRDKTLIGETDPDTGEPIYKTPVSFWMRITWEGVGFHDAVWQPYFGGELYKTNGSHGCINMSYSDAEKLYGMLSTGDPVVVHY